LLIIGVDKAAWESGSAEMLLFFITIYICLWPGFGTFSFLFFRMVARGSASLSLTSFFINYTAKVVKLAKEERIKAGKMYIYLMPKRINACIF
jgi:hypothetical protein